MADLHAAGLPPILVAHLFDPLDAALVRLLESLSPDDWSRPTVVPRWNVRQIAAHLLDTALRRLSFARDGWIAPPPASADTAAAGPGAGDRGLVDFVNALNAHGVDVYGRLSPPLLIELTRFVVPQLAEYLRGRDPFAAATFGVSWAGEAQSANWFDVARELTERWHHQQQIRLAVDRPRAAAGRESDDRGIMTPDLYRPVLDCFMRGLPHALRQIDAPPGTCARVVITGDCGGAWFATRDGGGWHMRQHLPAGGVASTTTMAQEIAWRVFTKGLSDAERRGGIQFEGDERIGRAAAGMTAIVG